MKNFKEIKDKILQTNSGFQVNNSTQLAEKIILLLRNRSLIKKTVNNFKNLRIKESRKVKILVKKEWKNFMINTPSFWKKKNYFILVKSIFTTLFIRS